MKQPEHQARLRRLLNENAAWKLLRSDNAPFTLAFLASLFSTENEVAYGDARAALDLELERARLSGEMESGPGATSYLRQWIKSGWLRELDDRLTRTDAAEVALRFCRGLDERDNQTTASHLRIVQEAVRDLAVALSPDPQARLALLEEQRGRLEQEIRDVKAGVIHTLSEREQAERVREVYQLASVLTADFRRVEDEIRSLDQSLRVQMIESDARGELVRGLLEKEALLAETDAGRAFESFYQLLADSDRSAELREQLRRVLDSSAAEHLRPRQSRFLRNLMRELMRESEHIFTVRSRTDESLRAYLEMGVLAERRAVDRLLMELERVAVNFADQSLNLRQETQLILNTGSVRLRSPDTMRLKPAEQPLDTRDVAAHMNSRTPSDTMLAFLDSVNVRQVALELRQCLRQQGPLAIADLVRQRPVTQGLEELVAYLRVGFAVQATRLPDTQPVHIKDRSGHQLLVKVPHLILSPDMFPEHIEELVL